MEKRSLPNRREKCLSDLPAASQQAYLLLRCLRKETMKYARHFDCTASSLKSFVAAFLCSGFSKLKTKTSSKPFTQSCGKVGGRGEAHHSTGPPTLIRLQVRYGVFYISAIQEYTSAFNCSLAIPPLIKMQLSHFKGRS